jgi:hypothetical protein
MTLEEMDKMNAVNRLSIALKYAEQSGDFDLEEIAHLEEAFRIICETVPAWCFAGFSEFEGPDV